MEDKKDKEDKKQEVEARETPARTDTVEKGERGGRRTKADMKGKKINIGGEED